MASLPAPIQEYNANIQKVKLVNDVYRGIDTARKHIDQYTVESNEDFEKRLNAATLDNYVHRSVQSLKNIIFRKPIDIENIENKELFEWCKKDIDLKGTSLNEFMQETYVNAKRDGYSFVFADTPASLEDVTTLLDEQQSNIRPYLVQIAREDLFYWETDSFGNYKVAAFYESYEKRESGLFGFTIETQIKVHFNNGITRIYRDGVQYGEDIQRGVKEILLFKVDDNAIPQFYGQAKINIKQMNRESEKSNYVRIANNPFPITYGLTEQDGTTTLSTISGLNFNNKQEGGFEWAEMSGQCYNISKEEINELSDQMMRIAVSFATGSNVKTATQVEKDSTEDESKLSDDAIMLETVFNKILQSFSKLKDNFKVEEDAIKVNTDFSSTVLSPEQQDRLLALYTQGVISKDRLLNALEYGEILRVLNDADKQAEEMKLQNENLGVE